MRLKSCGGPFSKSRNDANEVRRTKMANATNLIGLKEYFFKKNYISD